MSYCRISAASDVYVFPSETGIVCFACSLNVSRAEVTLKSRSAMIRHLKEHQARGQKVPLKAFTRLEEEMDEEGDEYGYKA